MWLRCLFQAYFFRRALCICLNARDRPDQKTLEPTSTQKRKHQINQLAVQAASMERDLMERSGASRLTKAQTHAKYGW